MNIRNLGFFYKLLTSFAAEKRNPNFELGNLLKIHEEQSDIMINFLESVPLLRKCHALKRSTIFLTLRLLYYDTSLKMAFVRKEKKLRCLEGDIMAHARKQMEANLNIIIIISFLGFYNIPRFPRIPAQKVGPR